MKRGAFRVAGHVDAYCTVCRRDVFIPEGSLKCPYGDHTVEPTSLAHMPKPAPRDGTREVAPTDDVATPPSAPALPPPERQTERVRLPDWIDDAHAWLALTERLARQLADDLGVLVGELRRVRGLRKLLDAVLERIEAPDSGRGS